jgi:hypothetical protein
MKQLSLTLLIALLGFNVNNNVTIKIGESKCYFKTKIKIKSEIGLVALHENETTCIKAFDEQKSSTPFYLYQISHGNGRLIKFKHKSKDYFIDPNRIFTKNGIEQTLKKYNNKYPKDVYNLVKSFSDSLISKIIGKHPHISYGHKGKKCVKLNVSSKFYARIFKTLFGDGAEKKQIPECLMIDNEKILKSLLTGLYDTDGHYPNGKENRLSYSTINENLVFQIQKIWLHFEGRCFATSE